MGGLATLHERNTKQFSNISQKTKARAGENSNLDKYHANEFIFSKNGVGIIVTLYPDVFTDGMFDNDEATEEILGNFFSLVSTNEAEELVSDAYAKSN